MALSLKVKPIQIHEITRISPSFNSPKSANNGISFPLPFFDIFWFKFPPVDVVLFYQLTESAASPCHFYWEIVPKLKQSLSLALLHYLPLAGKLKWSSDSPKPIIFYSTPNDGVSLTVAESNAHNFHTLTGSEIYRANELHCLVPELMISEEIAEMISFQITLFPDQGFSIGFRVHHGVTDGKALFMFVKSWGYLCKEILLAGKAEVPSNLPPNLTPFLDRSVIKDPTRLDLIYLKRWLEIEGFGHENQGSKRSLKTLQTIVPISDDLVRATFEFRHEDINKLKDKANLSSSAHGKPLHLSTFVLTLAYTITCLVKARGERDDRVVFIVFSVDCRSRLNPPLPTTYFGNCIMGSESYTKATDFIGQNGFAFAVNLVSNMVNKFNNTRVLEEAENQLKNPSTLKPDQEIQIISVAGSPRIGTYGSDFGLGELKKVEVVSIDRTGAISVAESRNGGGGVEIGLALKKAEMRNFIASLIFDGLCNTNLNFTRYHSCKL
ncbi:Transferase [Corchorus olitorius]|uniref:Transferase n=1 Tax=Corchorus olitorius TaxID=93759 RepID=A0A1R3GGW2_9ROSI|nr:Transferase [Corchorus olitorius]